MAPLSSPWFWAAVAVSLLAPLVYVILLRRVEKHGREAWWAVLSAFALGVVIVFPVTFALERLFVEESGVDGARTVNLILVAPIVEELLKALCVAVFWKKFTEPADGVVYGAAVGFGFAAIENAGYALRESGEEGAWGAFILTANRVVSASVLHAVLTALVGLALAFRRSYGTSPLWVPLAFVVAVVIHGGYNWFAQALTEGGVSWLIAAAFAIGFLALVPAGMYGVRRLDGRTRQEAPLNIAHRPRNTQ